MNTHNGYEMNRNNKILYDDLYADSDSETDLELHKTKTGFIVERTTSLIQPSFEDNFGQS